MHANAGGRLPIERLHEEVVGIDMEIPILTGATRRYVNLDNAASTPTFRPVVEKVDEFLRFYSNVHRGSGFKSQIASWVYEEARETVERFVRADPDHETVIFTKNTTESINRLANIYPFRPDGIVLTSLMEHHSNELPWRRRARVVHVGLNADGSLDLDDYARKLDQYRGQIDLVAITGASNVSGWVNPIHRLAREAHAAGAKILIDGAQLAPHRRIDMRPADDPEHLDFLAFSAHKMYAPYGVGVLVGERETFLSADPSLVGGGTVDIVTIETAYWTDLPDREEAGTPDIVGVVALAAATGLIEAVGWEAIRQHEEKLTRHALERLCAVPGVRIYGDTDAESVASRLGVIAFNVEGLHHALVAAILSYEGAIGVRSGCFCAHPYMLCLLGVPDSEANEVRDEILDRDRSRIPGAVRASFGMYNSKEDVDALCECLRMIAAGEHTGQYALDKESGEYHPADGYAFPFHEHFSLSPRLP